MIIIKGVGSRKGGAPNDGGGAKFQKFHTTAREPKRAHFRANKNTTKIQREHPQEREERMKIVAREGEKRAKLGGPGDGGSGESGGEGGRRRGGFLLKSQF